MMKQYNVVALKGMIANLNRDIANIDPNQTNRNIVDLYDMVRERRELAALVDNDGYVLPGVYVDAVAYNKCEKV